jgi:hypothetical protein
MFEDISYHGIRLAGQRKVRKNAVRMVGKTPSIRSGYFAVVNIVTFVE